MSFWYTFVKNSLVAFLPSFGLIKYGVALFIAAEIEIEGLRTEQHLSPTTLRKDIAALKKDLRNVKRGMGVRYGSTTIADPPNGQ